MPEKPGFQIGRRFYPFPSSFRLGDPVLVEELTGLDWNSFLDRLPDDDDPAAEEEGADPIAMLGLVGVAVWQQNPRWRRDKVVRYVQGLEMDAVETVGDEDEEAEDGPPAEPAEEPAETEQDPGPQDSESSASSSRSDSEPPSEPSSPTGSGTPTSLT